MLENLRDIYRDCFPYRDAGRWEPTDNELVICRYFGEQIAELKAEMRRQATALHGLRYANEDA